MEMFILSKSIWIGQCMPVSHAFALHPHPNHLRKPHHREHSMRSSLLKVAGVATSVVVAIWVHSRTSWVVGVICMATVGGRYDCLSARRILYLMSTVQFRNRCCHGGASIGSITRWPHCIVGWLFHNEPASRNRSKLGVSYDFGPILALPEAAWPGARGVVVVWAWAKTLLFPVVARKHDLEDGTDEEQSTKGMSAYNSLDWEFRKYDVRLTVR